MFEAFSPTVTTREGIVGTHWPSEATEGAAEMGVWHVGQPAQRPMLQVNGLHQEAQ